MIYICSQNGDHLQNNLAPINKICLNPLILWTLDPIDLAIEGLLGGEKKIKSLEILREPFFFNSSILLLLRVSICVFVCVWVLRVQIRKRVWGYKRVVMRDECASSAPFILPAANSLTETKN